MKTLYYIIRFWVYFLYINRKSFIRFKKPSVLIFYEPRFRFICDELLAQGLNFYFIPRAPFYSIWDKLFYNYVNNKQSVNDELYFQRYLEYQIERKSFSKFSRIIIKNLKSFTSVRKIILPKVNDDWTIDFINAFYDCGYETFIIDRETVVTKHRLNVIPPLLKGFKINASKIIVANDNHKKFFEEVKLNAKFNSKIVKVGHVASDYWFKNLNFSNFNPKKILYFSFGPLTYLNQLGDKKQNLNWNDLLIDIHKVLIDFFIKNKKFELNYKISKKGYRDYFEPRGEILELENCKLIDGKTNSEDLILNSGLIIGFQSTATIDALYSNVPVIYPGWGKIFKEIEPEILTFSKYTKNTGIYHAKSPLEFYDLLKKLTGKKINKEERENRDELIFSFTNNKNGDLSKKIISELEI